MWNFSKNLFTLVYFPRRGSRTGSDARSYKARSHEACSHPLPRKQRGDVLLESLIGVVLTGILGAGMAQVASRIAVSQHDAKRENLVMEQLRGRLQGDGLALCESTEVVLSLPGTEAPRAGVTCAQPVQVSVTIEGQTQNIQAPREINLSTGVVGNPALVVGTRQIATADSGSGR